MSGAIRDITITSVPEIELLDLRLDSSLSEDTADLFAEIKVWNHTEEMVGPQTAHVTLVKDNTIIAEAEGFTGNLSYRFEEKRFRELPEPVESGVISTSTSNSKILGPNYGIRKPPSSTRFKFI